MFMVTMNSPKSCLLGKRLLWIPLLLAALPLSAAEDANAILRRWIAAQNASDKRASQYTHTEETTRYVYGSNGQLGKKHTETHEVVFIEGLQYRKLVAMDGKPLNAKEQAKVATAMRQTAEQRRRSGHILPP